MLEVESVLIVGRPSIKCYNDACAICRENNMNACISCQLQSECVSCHRILGNCGHVFHEHCISKWVKDHPNCPICNQMWVNPKKV
jgi:RING-box protein 1